MDTEATAAAAAMEIAIVEPENLSRMMVSPFPRKYAFLASTPQAQSMPNWRSNPTRAHFCAWSFNGALALAI
jgi:hypothetical protein